ncbi:hypothetical protein WJX84_010882 [Apatococcus fuscideae]|uniref:Uncharacterized protein n=1 Tax=Apatococcus fuscideae TaxID=2026836 RepID=A0AAW1TCV9_9CHLO
MKQLEEQYKRSMSQQKPFIKEVAIQYCAAQGPGFSGPAPAADKPASPAKPADKEEAKALGTAAKKAPETKPIAEAAASVLGNEANGEPSKAPEVTQ